MPIILLVLLIVIVSAYFGFLVGFRVANQHAAQIVDELFTKKHN